MSLAIINFIVGQKNAVIEGLEATKNDILVKLNPRFTEQEGEAFLNTLGLMGWTIKDNNVENFKKSILESLT